MRALVSQLLSLASSMRSPGVDELRWLLPVRPGDLLTVREAVTEVRPSRREADRGMVSAREALNPARLPGPRETLSPPPRGGA